MACAVVVLGGSIENYEEIREKISKDSYFIYCDRGLIHEKGLNRRPDLAVGDFDSCPIPEGTEVITLPKEKDDTDGLYGVKEAIRRGYDEITILGATGGRIDHTLGNIYLLDYIYSKGLTGIIIGSSSSIEIVGKEYMLTAKVYEVLKSDIEYTRDKTIQYIKAKNMIIDYLETENNDRITSAKIQEMCGFTKQQARSVIDKMRSEKLINLKGKGPAARYVIFDGLSDNWVLVK